MPLKPHYSNCVRVDAGPLLFISGQVSLDPDGKLVGDVDLEGVRQNAAHISPVPGGVGPMTVTMLVHNTVQSAVRMAG